MRLTLLLTALGAALLTAFVHIYALIHHLYFAFWWLDIPVHILGGLTMGIFAIALFLRKRPYAYMLFVLGAATAWEVFEYSAGITYREPGYALDTVHDLLNDASGALFAYAFALRTLWRSN